MADKNLQMRRKRVDGGFDDYFPITKAVNVKLASGANVEEKLSQFNPTWAFGESTLTYTSFNGQTSQSQTLDLGKDFEHIEILAVHLGLQPFDQYWARRIVLMGDDIYHELHNKDGLFSALELNLVNSKMAKIQYLGAIDLYKVTKSGSILTFTAFNNYVSGNYQSGTLKVIWNAR